MKKTMLAILLIVSATAFSAMAANEDYTVNNTLKEQQEKHQQDLKRQQLLNELQLQDQKQKQLLQQQDAKLKRQQKRLGIKSSGPN
jgi:Spy/CpxP family protein refolding chaperone